MAKRADALRGGDMIDGKIVIESKRSIWDAHQSRVSFTDGTEIFVPNSREFETDEPRADEPSRRNLASYMQVFAGGEAVERIAFDGEIGRAFDGEGRQDGFTPLFVLRHGHMVLVINAMAFDDHVVVDVKGFKAGEHARLGAFGMGDGQRYVMGEDAGLTTTSHGWPATSGVTVLLGEQGEV